MSANKQRLLVAAGLMAGVMAASAVAAQIIAPAPSATAAPASIS